MNPPIWIKTKVPHSLSCVLCPDSASPRSDSGSGGPVASDSANVPMWTMAPRSSSFLSSTHNMSTSLLVNDLVIQALEINKFCHFSDRNMACVWTLKCIVRFDIMWFLSKFLQSSKVYVWGLINYIKQMRARATYISLRPIMLKNQMYSTNGSLQERLQLYIIYYIISLDGCPLWYW